MTSSRSRYVRIRAPAFSRRHIIDLAENLGRKYVCSVGLETPLLGISFEAVYEHVIYPDYEIVLIEDRDLGFDEDGNKILGEYDPWENTAYIDASLHCAPKDPRRTFTCWHEVGGHGVLQGEWLRKKLMDFRKNAHVITTDKSIESTTTNDLEMQANLFAAHAAAPSWLLNRVIQVTYRLNPGRYIRYLGPRVYSLDVHGHTVYYSVSDFSHLCRIIASQLKSRFGCLSVEALSYRVAESTFVIDETKPSFRFRRTASPTKPATALPRQPALFAAAV